jgi:hypothetical protein
MERRAHRQSEIITREALPLILVDIGIEREKKWTSERLIPRIRRVREQAEKLGEKNSVMQLFWEEFLSAQHTVMEEKNKGLLASPLKFKANPLRAANGVRIMRSTVKSMEKYLAENNKDLDPAIKARTSRFQGRYADHMRKYRKAEDYYMNGYAYFNSLQTPEERFNRLEFLGFISFSRLRQGEKYEGIQLTQWTLTKLDQSEDGKWLKENNYQTWAVWKSGIEIRTAEYILKRKLGEYNNLAENFLNNAKSILKMPNGDREIFRLRLDELESVKKTSGKIS